jgi:mono/diheme cytochrome c family protein
MCQLDLRFLWLPLLCCLVPACQQKMAVQPGARPDAVSTFFPDGRADRPVPPGTVPRGYLRTDLHFYTGKRTREPREAAPSALLVGAGSHPLGALTIAVLEHYRYLEDANYVDTFPFPVTREVLEHGRNRFMIYCVVCHDARGDGHGKIVERGYTQPPTYHSERLRQIAVGHFFDVITNGYGSMPEYKQQIPPRDRWAIAAYIRALQWSQHFPVSDLTDTMKKESQQTAAAGPAGRSSP